MFMLRWVCGQHEHDMRKRKRSTFGRACKELKACEQKYLASSSGIVVDHSPHHPMVQGLSPITENRPALVCLVSTAELVKN